LPYYKRGNLQDNINANNINKTFFPEKNLLVFFLKVCYALKVLHTYNLPNIPLMTPSEIASEGLEATAVAVAAQQPSNDQDSTLLPYGKLKLCFITIYVRVCSFFFVKPIVT
jgi:hypothetical protein